MLLSVNTHLAASAHIEKLSSNLVTDNPEKALSGTERKNYILTITDGVCLRTHMTLKYRPQPLCVAIPCTELWIAAIVQTHIAMISYRACQSAADDESIPHTNLQNRGKRRALL